MFTAKTDNNRTMIFFFEWAFNNGKYARIDNVVEWVHKLNSGNATHYDIPRDIYRAVSLANKIDNTLFKDGIPEHSRKMLLDTYRNYDNLKHKN